MIVCKFGGTSVADAGQLQRVREIVNNDDQRQIIVTSAPAGMTNALLTIWTMVQAKQNWLDAWTKIVNRFHGIVNGFDNLAVDIDTPLREVEQRIQNDNADRDYIASRGEAIHSRIVAAVLGAQHVEATDVIKFDSAGQLDIETSYALIRAACVGRGRVVIGGFYGSSPNGMIKTLTRGGSDETAGHVAAAMKANICEIWTDVSGIATADPREVDDPLFIRNLTSDQVFEMAYRGAKVLHPGAVAPVAKLRIPIRVLNTNRPNDPGTWINDNVVFSEVPPVIGIAGQKGYTTFIIKRPGMNDEVGVGAKALNVFREMGVPYDHSPSGLSAFSVVVRTEHLNGNIAEIVSRLKCECDAEVEVKRANLDLITIVGNGLDARPAILAQVFAALAKHCIPTLMISMGAGGASVTIGVDPWYYRRAMRSLHNVLFPE